MFRGLKGADFAALGIPTEAEYVAAYCRRTGAHGIPHWEFYLIFNMFRIAAILHGVLARALQGNAASAERVRAGKPRAARRRRRLGHGATATIEESIDMDFEHSPKVKDLAARLARFMDENVYPAEAAFAAEVEENRKRGNAWVADADHGGTEGQGARGGTVEPVPARIRPRRRAHQSRIRAAVRDHGPLVDRARGLQLQRARHRQHGSAGPLRHRRAEEALARAAACGARSARASR